jgi:hypothetical protein
MKNVLTWFKENPLPIILLIVLVFSLVQCSSNSTQKKVAKNLVAEVDSLRTEIEQLKEDYPTKKEIEIQNSKMMYDFLIYEDDLDKGKISLSQIQEKLPK